MARRKPTYRVGRKVGRTVYRMVGDEPSDDDQFVGVMDTRELAEEFVEARNRMNTLDHEWRDTKPPAPDGRSLMCIVCGVGKTDHTARTYCAGMRVLPPWQAPTPG